MRNRPLPRLKIILYSLSLVSIMANSGMNPKTLQYLMGHSDISVTMNTYTHVNLDDAVSELKRMEELRVKNG